MANIKWTGIEQTKYGLTARWYVSAYYGNDNDVDAVGLYNPSTNPTGHGGPTRPFATLEKIHAEGTYADVVVFDSGYYSTNLPFSKYLKYVADGQVILEFTQLNILNYFYGVILINCEFGSITGSIEIHDCKVYYSTLSWRYAQKISNCLFVECSFSDNAPRSANISNCTIVNCTGRFGVSNYSSSTAPLFLNMLIINCSNLVVELDDERKVGSIIDYSVIIGTIKTDNPINGKTTGVTVEDFKADGKYFVKSYSEVDLFGNALGSGASVAQLQGLFCNYLSPIYIDTWQEVNFHLKTTAPDILKYGGLNGTFIGALPVMHWFDSDTLWNTYKDATNTTDLEQDSVTGAIRISGVSESGTFRSTRINLTKAITANPAKFFANLVYNIEGTVKQGVSNQRIDTTVDLQPDNIENQRVVYDFRMAIAPNDVDALGAFKNYELDREPTVDASGYSHLDDNFDPNTEVKQTIGAIMIEFTLRKVVIA